METNTTLRKYKWFWAWQDIQREHWLTQMSAASWHLESIDRLGLRFNFRSGDPLEFSYQQDFRTGSREEIGEYITFIEDAGWAHVVSHSGWHYFRTPVSAEGTEFFSDSDSKLGKYQRLKATFPLLYPFYFVIFLNFLDRYPLWFTILLVSVFILDIIYVTVSIIGVSNRIKEIERGV